MEGASGRLRIEKSKFEGIYCIDGCKNIATISSAPGSNVYGEKIIKVNGKEYRVWDPYRSKWAAAILKGLKKFPVKRNSKVLYLGSASGTSASHIADIAIDGEIYCVDIAERVMRDLIFVAEKRKNMIPILADATQPEGYEFIGKVDVILQDVAMPNQDKIIIENGKKFLEKGKYALVAVKARSINVAAKPSEVFKEFEESVKKEFEIEEKVRLEPYEKDHAVFLLKKK